MPTFNSQPPYILSIYFGYHDSNIAVASKNEIILHLEAERVFRRKHMRATKKEMEELISTALEYLNLSIDDVQKLYLASWNNQFGEGTIKILGKLFHPTLVRHHESHIGTGAPSNFNQSLIVCADGGSEDGTTKIYLKDQNQIKLLDDLDDTPMTGKFYGTITQMIIEPRFGRAHDTAPGKTMGLVAMGEAKRHFTSLLEKHKTEINKLHFEDCNHLLKLFGLSYDYSRPWEDKARRNLAHTAQRYWENVFIKQLKKYRNFSSNIIMVGGCAYNLYLNSSIVESKLYKHIYVSPVSGDCGQSIGAILFHHPSICCNYPFLGRSFGDIEKNPKALKRFIKDILNHKIVAWYQGASESGPRALGHRSFLGLPDSMEMKKRLNDKVKKREPYRPVAPMIAAEYLGKFFKTTTLSPFMTFAPKTREKTKKIAPAIVHLDNTSRVQTVTKESNPFLHKALLKIGKETGAPILMNTSLNLAGEPIVDTPEDAFKTFYKSEADILYINGKRYER